jgi:hypothetical protein
VQEPIKLAVQQPARPSIAKALIGLALIVGGLAMVGLAIAIVIPKPKSLPAPRPAASAQQAAANPKAKNTVRVENGVLKTTWPVTQNDSVATLAQSLASLTWDMSKNTRADVDSIEIALLFVARDGSTPTMGTLVADLRELRSADGPSVTFCKPIADRFAIEIGRSPYTSELRSPSTGASLR